MLRGPLTDRRTVELLDHHLTGARTARVCLVRPPAGPGFPQRHPPNVRNGGREISPSNRASGTDRTRSLPALQRLGRPCVAPPWRFRPAGTVQLLRAQWVSPCLVLRLPQGSIGHSGRYEDRNARIRIAGHPVPYPFDAQPPQGSTTALPPPVRPTSSVSSACEIRSRVRPKDPVAVLRHHM